MKKLFAALLSGALVLSLAGCVSENPTGSSTSGTTAKQEALALYKTATQNIEQAMGENAFQCQYASDIAITAGGQTQNMSVTGDMTVSRKDALKLSMVTTTAMSGFNMEIAMYSDGQTLYVSTFGTTLKQTLDAETIEQLEAQIADQTNAAANLDGAVAIEESVVPTGDGGYSLQLILDPSTLSSVNGLLGNMTESSSGSFNIKSMALTAVLDKDKMPQSVSLKANMDVTENEQTSNMDMTLRTTYANVGADVEVTPPDAIDFENATESSSILSAA